MSLKHVVYIKERQLSNENKIHVQSELGQNKSKHHEYSARFYC